MGKRSDRGPAAERPIYLDYQATTPADPRVVDAMLPWFHDSFGNPNSQHAVGAAASAAVETARAALAALIGADAREIVFTSGATEANNLAIKGAAGFYRTRKPRIVTCVTEHKCVLEACRRMEAEGVEVVRLPVGADGLLDPAAVEAALDEATALVSVMAVNNETGIIQPLAEIGALCRAHGAYFHTDAAQAFGKIPLDVDAMSIDLMSISGHKAYGPMGVGALYVRRRPRVRLLPLIDGGGQERGLRSGTLPTPLCVGLGVAASLAQAEMADEAARLRVLRGKFLDRLRDRVADVLVNGDMSARVPGNLNLAFPGLEGEALLAHLDGRVALSAGSACTSGAVESSYVLRGMGLSGARARASLRVGLGRFTTDEEVEVAADAVAEAVEALRDGQGADATAPAGRNLTA